MRLPVAGMIVLMGCAEMPTQTEQSAVNPSQSESVVVDTLGRGPWATRSSEDTGALLPGPIVRSSWVSNSPVHEQESMTARSGSVGRLSRASLAH